MKSRLQRSGWGESASFTEDDFHHFKVYWQEKGKMEVRKTFEKSSTSIQLLTLPCWYCGSSTNFAFLMRRSKDWRVTCWRCHDMARTHEVQDALALTECGVCKRCHFFNGVVVRDGQKLAVCVGCYTLVSEFAERGIV